MTDLAVIVPAAAPTSALQTGCPIFVASDIVQRRVTRMTESINDPHAVALRTM